MFKLSQAPAKTYVQWPGMGGGDFDDFGLLPDLIEDRPTELLSSDERRTIKSRNSGHGLTAARQHDARILARV